MDGAIFIEYHSSQHDMVLGLYKAETRVESHPLYSPVYIMSFKCEMYNPWHSTEFTSYDCSSLTQPPFFQVKMVFPERKKLDEHQLNKTYSRQAYEKDVGVVWLLICCFGFEDDVQSKNSGSCANLWCSQVMTIALLMYFHMCELVMIGVGRPCW